MNKTKNPTPPPSPPPHPRPHGGRRPGAGRPRTKFTLRDGMTGVLLDKTPEPVRILVESHDETNRIVILRENANYMMLLFSPIRSEKNEME